MDQLILNNSSLQSYLDIFAENTTDKSESDYSQEYNYWDYFDFIIKEEIPVSLKLAFLYSQRYVTFIIWLLALCGNVLVICIMLQKKNKTSSTTALFLSLAVADLTVGFYSLNLGLAINGFDVFASELGCEVFKVFFSIVVSCRAASSWTLVALTIERMLSVCIPHKVKIFCTFRNSRIFIAFIWVFALAIGFLNAYIAGTSYFDPVRSFCFLRDNKYSYFYRTYYIWFMFSMEILIPWVTLLLTSITIITCLNKGKNTVSKASNKRNHHVTVIILIAVVVFLITQFSYSFFILYSTLAYKAESLETYLYYTYIDNILLLYKDLNCALNFYIYFLTGSRFRKESKLLFLSFYLSVKTCFGRNDTE